MAVVIAALLTVSAPVIGNLSLARAATNLLVTNQVILNPADAYVYQSYPNTNNGSAAVPRVDGSPIILSGNLPTPQAP